MSSDTLHVLAFAAGGRNRHHLYRAQRIMRADAGFQIAGKLLWIVYPDFDQPFFHRIREQPRDSRARGPHFFSNCRGGHILKVIQTCHAHGRKGDILTICGSHFSGLISLEQMCIAFERLYNTLKYLINQADATMQRNICNKSRMCAMWRMES